MRTALAFLLLALSGDLRAQNPAIVPMPSGGGPSAAPSAPAAAPAPAPAPSAGPSSAIVPAPSMGSSFPPSAGPSGISSPGGSIAPAPQSSFTLGGPMSPGRPIVPLTRPETSPSGRAAPLPRGPEAQASGSPPIVRTQPRQPPADAPIVRDPNFVNNINQQQVYETVPGYYYWHYYSGYPYCHYYDHYGVHWYGYYYGPSFYWTRYYGNYWWWYDPSYARWLYWNDGTWWWNSPYGPAYAYGSPTYAPEPDLRDSVAAAPQTPSSARQGTVYFSPDGLRQVQVVGAGRQAFLYKREENREPLLLRALAGNVKNVEFSGGEEALVIRLELTDGTHALYDADGAPKSRR